MSEDLKLIFEKQGFVSPIQVTDVTSARRHRQSMEAIENDLGGIHYKNKIHTICESAYELVSQTALLDAVEKILGPDIMVYNVTYIIKEANSPSYVSWHQDLTYWGLDSEDQVSAWVALSVADQHSGCMRMIPGSHRAGQQQHDLSSNDETNVLYQGQTIRNVDDRTSVLCPLEPGQASLHHGWTMHSSAPNQSDDRRIGLNIQYIAPHVRQFKKSGYSAMLLRGQDHHGHYTEEHPPQGNLNPADMVWRDNMDKLYQEISGTPNN